MKKLNLMFAVALMSILLLCLASCGEPKFEYEEYSDGYKISGRGEVSDTELVIPEKYKGKPILAIGDDAFKGCTDITSITLPDSVEVIEMSAFEGCTALKTINTPSSLTMIGESAFRGCSSLEDFDIPDEMTKFYSNAFSDTPLIEVENGVTYIDNWAVAFDNELEVVSIREGTLGIAHRSLGAAQLPKEVYLPSTLKSVSFNDSDFFSKNSTVYFNGTKANWEAIFKDKVIILTKYTVVCTDETLTYGN